MYIQIHISDWLTSGFVNNKHFGYLSYLILFSFTATDEWGEFINLCLRNGQQFVQAMQMLDQQSESRFSNAQPLDEPPNSVNCVILLVACGRTLQACQLLHIVRVFVSVLRVVVECCNSWIVQVVTVSVVDFPLNRVTPGSWIGSAVMSWTAMQQALHMQQRACNGLALVVFDQINFWIVSCSCTRVCILIIAENMSAIKMQCCFSTHKGDQSASIKMPANVLRNTRITHKLHRDDTNYYYSTAVVCATRATV